MLETRLRKVIMELIEPTIRRGIEQGILIEENHRASEVLRRRTDGTEMMLDRINSRLSLIDEFSRKLMQFEGELRISEASSEHERQKIVDILDVVRGRVSNCEENIVVLQGQTQTLKNDLTAQVQESNAAKTALSDKISVFKADTENNFKMQHEKAKILEVSIANVDKKLSSTALSLQETDIIAKKAYRAVETALEDLGILNESILNDKKEVKANVEKIRVLTMQSSHQSTQQIKYIKDQIKTDLPLQTQFQISDLLYNAFTDVKILKNIAETETKFFTAWENIAIPAYLKVKFEESRKRNEEIKELPLPIEPPKKQKHSKNNSKSKSKGKSKGKISLSDMLKLDNKVKQQEEKVKNLEELISSVPISRGSVEIRESTVYSKPNYDQQSDDSDSDSASDKSSFNLEMLIQNSEALGKILGIKDFTPEISSLTQSIEANHQLFSDFCEAQQNQHSLFSSQIIEINSKIDLLQELCSSNFPQIDKSIASLNSELESQISKQSEDHEATKISLEASSSRLQSSISHLSSEFSSYVEGTSKIITTLELQVQQAVYECNSSSAQRKRDHNDNNFQFQNLHNLAEGLQKQQETLSKSLEKASKSIHLLTEFSKITVSLQSQDEIDRESIALIGYKEGKSSKVRGLSTSFNKTSISLDKQCISCSGQVNMITSAFKIACLAYTPSPVLFRGSAYQRTDLLEMQRNIFEGAVEESRVREHSSDRIRFSKTPKPGWRPPSSLSMCVPTGAANTPDLPPISLSKRINNY